MNSTNAFWATAYHEAGHAVAGIVAGLGCGTVTIVPDDDGEALGSATVANPLVGWERGDGPRRPLLESYAIVRYAQASAGMALS